MGVYSRELTSVPVSHQQVAAWCGQMQLLRLLLMNGWDAQHGGTGPQFMEQVHFYRKGSVRSRIWSRSMPLADVSSCKNYPRHSMYGIQNNPINWLLKPPQCTGRLITWAVWLFGIDVRYPPFATRLGADPLAGAMNWTCRL